MYTKIKPRLFSCSRLTDNRTPPPVLIGWLANKIVTISIGTQQRLGGLMGIAHYILTWPQISSGLIT